MAVPHGVAESDVLADAHALSDALGESVVLPLAALEPDAVAHAAGDAVGEGDDEEGAVRVTVADSDADVLSVPLGEALDASVAEGRCDPEGDTEGETLSEEVPDCVMLGVVVWVPDGVEPADLLAVALALGDGAAVTEAVPHGVLLAHAEGAPLPELLPDAKAESVLDARALLVAS